MAIYHLTAKTISRGSGSAKSRSEYINRDGQYKKDHEEVLYKTSGNMPDWANENHKYWEAADIYERENGRLFKQLEFSLPKELTTDQQKELVLNFVEQLTTTKSGNLPYSYALHKGHDRENPHCHLMISERLKDEHTRTPETWFKRANSKEKEKGGAKKTTDLMPKEWLIETRMNWSLQANKALERAGHEQRIDHRSLKEQGIDRQPTKHRGVALNAMLMNGKITKEEIEKDISEPINKEEKKAELAEALQIKSIIMQGIQVAKKEFAEEKKQRLADERAKQEKLELEKQKEMKNKIEQQMKRKGMGFER